MTEILKTETEGIVNLAEELTNLETKIEHLQQPVCQLREEILVRKRRGRNVFFLFKCSISVTT